MYVSQQFRGTKTKLLVALAGDSLSVPNDFCYYLNASTVQAVWIADMSGQHLILFHDIIEYLCFFWQLVMQNETIFDNALTGQEGTPLLNLLPRASK